MRRSTKQHTLITCHRNRKIKTATAISEMGCNYSSLWWCEKALQENWILKELHFEGQARFGEVRQKQERIRLSLIKLHVIYCLLNSHSVPGTKNAKIKYSVWPLVKFPFVGLKPLKTYHTIHFIIPQKWETNGTCQFFTVVLK